MLPCLPTLITPYSNPAPGAQTAFNLAHSRTRVRIENTFGIWKSRFQCLCGLRVCPERECDIIVACTVLHNIAILHKDLPPLFDPFLEEETNSTNGCKGWTKDVRPHLSESFKKKKKLFHSFIHSYIF